MTIPVPPASAPSASSARTPWTKHALHWGVTLGLLAIAWGVHAVALPDTAPEQSFTTRASVGETASTRNLTVTVTDVRASRGIVTAAGHEMPGTWLVVELDAETIDSSVIGTLGFAELTIGERTFRATERDATFYRDRLMTGVSRSGSLAFELPPDALSGVATLRLSTAVLPMYDGVIDVSLDLGEVPVEDQVTLSATGWTR